MEKLPPEAAASAQAVENPGLRPPAIILVEPQLGENIGQAARAMANFGLAELRLVAPRDGWPSEKALAAASGASHIIERAVLFPTVEAAIADLHFVGATTARIREMVKPVFTPETAARDFAGRAEAGQLCGVLFGRERSGLENDEVALADALVMAPVDPAFASLNLAQAVLIVGYEWRKAVAGASLGRGTEFDGPAREGVQLNKCIPATRGELLDFFAHIEGELSQAGFFKTDEKRSSVVRNIRNMFHRASLTDQEVRTLRGIVVALTGVRRSRHRVE
ncbi:MULTISPECIES: RNA methyltransferase [Rhodomicrobium]|uniref:RNA methyltransferase n=1 Tax=Rhodomicrobium TaxID=1068 RepID=UPI000B4A90A0|nr:MULTISPECIES: RNA methyltransferase [Rhodomicrobium]